MATQNIYYCHLMQMTERIILEKRNLDLLVSILEDFDQHLNGGKRVMPKDRRSFGTKSRRHIRH